MKRVNVWEHYSEEQLNEVENLAVRYKECLDYAKTERESVEVALKYATEHGYMDIKECIKENRRLSAGDKVYAECMGKTVILFQIGKELISTGMNILGAHIDSPRLDVKQVPLYEDTNMAYLDTHYYGGIKKYQWVCIPLAMHGIVAKKDGTIVKVIIGEKDDDPVLAITDLLIHISQEQMEKKASVVIEGEKLDVLVGSKPAHGYVQGAEKVKEEILRYLYANYGIKEEDFISAEFEIVPAGKSRDCGLDRSMIMAYGQDDRVCAFPSLFAMLETEEPERTTCCILVDKEEIGSVGATGMQSAFFKDMVAEIVALTEGESYIKTERALRNSYMLSTDVSAAYDPLFADAFEKKNSATMGSGIVINKYTGARGKNSASDANAEYIAKIRSLFGEYMVGFQTAEMGRVDLGGGSTIAYVMANYGMQVLDAGVAVLSMHAPWEITSKADIYESYKAYKVFLKYMK